MAIFILFQFFSIIPCVKVMKSKSIIARDRWICSLLIFLVPVAGVFIYMAFRNFVSTKTYKFFSQRFIDAHLS